MFPKEIESLKLLFRGSEHNYKAAEFHTKCDNIRETVTIAETEFGKVIGGFNADTWNHGQSPKNNQSFLFSLTLNEKYAYLNNAQNTTVGNSTYGPTFGGGHDLYISNECNTSISSFTNFPTTFNTGSKYTNGQAAHTAFSGA